MTASLKRDMDMIRDLLLEIEKGQTVFKLVDAETAAMLGIDATEGKSAEDIRKIELHLKLLADAKFISLTRSSGGFWHVTEIHWEGYDFIDSVRDPKIWEATKDGAKKAGGFSVDLMKALAKGVVKKQIEKYTGVELDL